MDPSPYSLASCDSSKNETELQRIRQATEITVAGHVAAMKAVRPGLYEYQLESLVESTFPHERVLVVQPFQQLWRVVATRRHFTIQQMTVRLKDETLVLIDAGAGV